MEEKAERIPIVFKSEDSMWQTLASGQRRFDMRKWDIGDDRIYRLSQGRKVAQAGPHGEYQEWVPGESEVSFMNKATGENVTFRYLGIEFMPWAPGWCFIIVGERLTKEV